MAREKRVVRGLVLRETDTTIYALRIPDGSPVTAEEVKSCFRLIYSEWNIGVVGG